LLATVMYGAGVHVMECLRLRVQDIDFSGNQILVREPAGGFRAPAPSAPAPAVFTISGSMVTRSLPPLPKILITETI